MFNETLFYMVGGSSCSYLDKVTRIINHKLSKFPNPLMTLYCYGSTLLNDKRSHKIFCDMVDVGLDKGCTVIVICLGPENHFYKAMRNDFKPHQLAWFPGMTIINLFRLERFSFNKDEIAF